VDLLQELINLLLRPVVAWAMLAMILGQIVKTQIFTEARSKSTESHWFWWWGRKTLALQPVAIGVLIGVFWPGQIEEGYQGGTLLGCVYFAVGGGASVWLFETAKGLAKKRGVDIGSLPGLDESVVVTTATATMTTVQHLPAPPAVPSEARPPVVASPPDAEDGDVEP